MADTDSKSTDIAPLIFDRLIATLDPRRMEEEASLQKCALDDLGREIRRWRLRQGYTRAVLADKLQLDVDRLTCLENGIAQVEDVGAEPLLLLPQLVAEDKTHPLRAALEEYLAGLSP